MQEYWELMMNSERIIQVGGLALVTLIVFAETGLFFCFFLPGDYLLFTAGLFCGTGVLKVPLILLISCIVIAAIAGNYVGYYFGLRVGKNLYQRKDSFFFKKKHLMETEAFFNKYGGRTLIMARFLPVIRTFAPILAGVIQMEIAKFSRFVSIGALLWGISIPTLGYYLGQLYPGIVNYLEYIVIAFILVTTVITIQSFMRGKK